MVQTTVANDSVVLSVLARRGARSIVQALARADAPMTLRGLARDANVPHATAARVVRDLEALAVVEVVRPGRDAQLRWRSGPVADWLAALAPPDVPVEVERVFAAAYAGPGAPRRWLPPEGGALPVRLVVLTDEQDDALDAVGPALDAVAAAGWPAPQVAVHDPATLDLADPVAAAMLQLVR